MSKVTSSAVYFKALPRPLQNFFTKYPPSISYADKPVSTLAKEANPFLPNVHPVTKKYHEPSYSLRRASDIYKTAYRWGVEEMLPPMPQKKFFQEKYDTKNIMRGVLSPKGHAYERMQAQKKQQLAEGLAGIENMIVSIKGKKFARKLAERKKNQKTWF